MHRMPPILLACGALLLAQSSRPPSIRFQIHEIDPGCSEVAAIVDVNNDGRLDIVSAEEWFEAPNWTPHRFRQINYTNDYIDAFSNLPVDVDGDGYMDLVTSSWFAREIAWWRNPGKGQGAWTKTVIDSGFPNEFSFLVDLNNDGKALEILTQSGSQTAPLAWYELKNKTWVKHIVSPRSHGHGIGAGDVNGDGRNDIVTPAGWFEAPADLAGGEWKHHASWDDSAVPPPPARGGAAPPEPKPRFQMGFMQVIDINGDGRNDVVAGNGHGYGLMWIEQGAGGQWTKRTIDDTWSQVHGGALADLNGDGRPDFITGKRFFAHNGRDPGARDPVGFYWYEFRTTAQGAVEWIRHIIAYGGRVGGGVAAVPVADIDGDGDLDIVAAGKSGLFLLENLSRGPRR